MNFTDLKLNKIYDSSDSSIVDDFLIPTLSRSLFYDRGVGFFSSGWLREASAGMVKFAENGGVARWITSPILSKDDYEAIARGEEGKADQLLKDLLLEQVDDLENTLNENTLIALSWMVADGIITFKIAIPTNHLDGGDFHDKFGIFRDVQGNRISFSGSYNDSMKGSLNYESIKVFWSWDLTLNVFVEKDSSRFEKLWSDQDRNVRVFDFPQAVAEKIIRFRTKQRPYKLKTESVETNRPSIPKNIVLREYQNAAIESWVNNNYRGIFYMATGTGKTITSLSAIIELLKNNNDLFIIIVCPYIHLVDQWITVCQKFNVNAVACYDSNKKWSKDIKDKLKKGEIKKYLGSVDASIIIAVTSIPAFLSNTFQSILSKVDLKKFLIADEVHHLGTLSALSRLPKSIEYRLGLSATPERWCDYSGTAGLYEYFGGIVYSLNLKEAIYVHDVLCKYDYMIHTIELLPHELNKYVEITKRIYKRYQEIKQLHVDDEILGFLLRERANVLNNAENKIPLLKQLLSNDEDHENTLIYTSPDLLNDVNALLSKMHLMSHQITYKEPSEERNRIIAEFEKGTYSILTAIKCLDEGVDIPQVKKAYILASSGNPREYTQRRGRILRKSENKEKAIIIDFITVPSLNPNILDERTLSIERSILRKEFMRLKHFADCAENKHEAILSVYDLASLYNIQDVLVRGNDE